MRISDWSSDVCSSDLFTVDQGADTERYQGIVELEGRTLSECTHSYFRHSEQLEAGVKVAAGRVDTPGGPAWRAGALMRSEERGLGTACVSKWTSRCAPYGQKKQKASATALVLD